MKKFKHIKIGQEFIYNNLQYIKVDEDKGFNKSSGRIIISLNEKIKLIKDENNYLQNNFELIITSIVSFLIGCGIGLFIFRVFL